MDSFLIRGGNRLKGKVEISGSKNSALPIVAAALMANGKTTLHGKVWRRGQEEPKKWDIEFNDPMPNLEGSPFLYGYVLGHVDPAPGTEVYFDNVVVTPNKK